MLKSLILMLNNKSKTIEIILTQLAIIILTILLHFRYDTSKILILISVIISVINILRIKYDENFKTIIKKTIKYRYIIALIVFILCVILKLHGSSINNWNTTFPDKLENSRDVILGQARPIRSDEWIVHTSYYISQTYNDFKLDNYMLSYSGQNMIIGYNAPVLDITIIAKPFTWGYVLLGAEYGLSWYWCMKLILLILLSYETVMIITNKNKLLSLLAVFLIAFGPSMQWWFVPHMCDVFFWAMAILVIGYHFFTAKTKLIKNITTILAAPAIIGFTLALFPSLQVPLGIIAFIILIVSLIRDKKEITFKKIDLIRILIIGLVVIGVLAYFFCTSIDALKTLSETVYPGERLETGGAQTLRDLFTDLTTIFLPYKQIPYSNSCETSSFIHFGPFFMMLFPFLFYKLKKQKKERIIGTTLFIIMLVQIAFMLFGFPLWLSKLTLFKYINRMKIVYGFVAILFSLWSIDKIFKNKDLISKYIYFPILLIYGIINYLLIDSLQLTYLRIEIYIFEIIVFMIILGLIYFKKKNFVMISIILLIVMASFTINPIARSINPIKNHQISKEIENIITKDDSRWLSVGLGYVNNFLLSNGANVINATNFYPDFYKWKIIDSDNSNAFYYNRYAHIEIHLTENEQTYTMPNADAVIVNMNYDKLKPLEIKYIFTNEELNSNLENIKFKLKYHDITSNYSIYEVIYN